MPNPRTQTDEALAACIREADWDGDGAPAVTEDMVAIAKRVLCIARDDGLPEPLVGVMRTSAIALFWSIVDRAVCTQIRSDGSLACDWEGPGFLCGSSEWTVSDLEAMVRTAIEHL